MSEACEKCQELADRLETLETFVWEKLVEHPCEDRSGSKCRNRCHKYASDDPTDELPNCCQDDCPEFCTGYGVYGSEQVGG